MFKHRMLFVSFFFLWCNLINAQGLQLNGNSTYIKIPSNSALQLHNFTLEAWIYISGTGVGCGTSSTGQGLDKGTVIPLITKGRNEKDETGKALNYFFGYRTSDRKLVADFEDNTASMSHHTAIGAGALPLYTWTHVAVTYNTAGVWKMYINGKLDATVSLGNAYTPQSKSLINIAIGSALNSAGVAEGYFNGRLDEIRIWNIERSSTQIAGYYNQEIIAHEGLAARYGLNDSNGTTATNSVASCYNGTLISSPVWITGYNAFMKNKAPIAPASSSPASGNTVSNTSPNLCVAVSDPEGKPLTVSYYARKKTNTKKFTLVLLPDPQYYVAEPQLTAYIKGACNIMFKSQTKWIAANRAARNIAFVGGLGDCSDHGDKYSVEWKRVDTALKTLEDPALTGLAEGIPYGLPVGNHDQAPRGDPKGTTYYFNKYFGITRFTGRNYYGGHYGKDNDNSYQFFSASGINFLVICPEWDMSSGFSASGGVLAWMENLVKTYPDHKVIILSHYLINLSASFTPQGSVIYNRLKKYPNFLLMASGHIVNESSGAGEARRSDVYDGRTVHTITQDYQARLNGGNGFLRTYEFDPKNNKVAIQTYSPYTKTYETDENSQFNLDMDLSVASSFKLIGQQTGVTSGSTTCLAWQSLEKDAVYEWYVSVSDGQMTVKSTTWSFTTPASPLSATAENSRLTAILPEPPAANLATVSPNPNNTKHITVSLQQEVAAGFIEVYNIAGQLQLKKDIGNLGMTIYFAHNLPAGMYKILIRQKDNTTVSSNNFLISR